MKILLYGLLIMMINIRCRDQVVLKPVLVVKNRSLEMGTIKFDSAYNLDFEIKNAGGASLVIDTVTSSCGCSVPSLNKKVLNPLEEGKISVTYKPVDPGKFEKSLVIKSNSDSVYTVLKFKGISVK